MMHRLDATRIAVELAGESPIIGGVGNSTFDLVPFEEVEQASNILYRFITSG